MKMQWPKASTAFTRWGIPLALQIHAVVGLATLTRGERYNNCRELERLGNILPAEAEKAY